jgi:adhesin HecA-like repeat protein
MNRKQLAIAVGLALAALANAPAAADTHTWVTACTNNNWSQTTCWSPTGQPQGGDRANVYNSGTSNVIVTYDSTASPAPLLSGLYINATGAGTITLSQTQHDLASGLEWIGLGLNYTGIHSQSGGTNTISGSLVLGSAAGSTGTYNLSGSGILSAATQIVGNSGTGIFTQSGGQGSATGSLYVGYLTGSSGSYALSGSGSTLSANNQYVGYSGNGTFTQSGGTNTITDTLTLGKNSGSSGTYNLNGGILNAGSIVRGSGTSAFNWTNGTLNLANGSIDVWELHANGVSTFSGNGSITAPSLYVGLGGNFILSGAPNLTADNEYIAGQFVQNGGTNTIGNDLRLDDGGCCSRGTYTLSGGTLTVNRMINTFWGDDTLKIDGGTLSVGGGNGSIYVTNLIVTSRGSHTLSGTGTVYVAFLKVGEGTGTGGTFSQSGGQNRAYLLSLYDGAYNLSGGSLTVETDLKFESGVSSSRRFVQSGGSNAVTNNLAIAGRPGSDAIYDLQGGTLKAGAIQLNAGGTFNQTGGAIDPSTSFNQSGGTVTGDLQNSGIYTYNSGTFSGRLSNRGTAIFNAADFTAGDGMLWASPGTLTISSGRTFTLNGQGLDNQGTIALAGGTLSGLGPLVNNMIIKGTGTVGGSGGFINNMSLTLSGGDIVLSNTGANENRGIISLSGNNLVLQGATLANTGTINVSSAVTGTGILANSYGGITKGKGYIDASLVNSGAIIASGGTLTLGGSVTNNVTGRLEAGSGSTLMVTNGLPTNSGTISLSGGTFDNNGHALVNSGQITGNGTVATSGITNTGTMTLWGAGPTAVNGSVTNNNLIGVTGQPVTFNNAVVNNGVFKLTGTTVTFAGGYTENGAYLSDPAKTYVTNMTVGTSGYLVGGTGDEWHISGNFLNSSTQNTLWNTNSASLFFNGTGMQTLDLPGADLGPSGYANNFAWGRFELVGGTQAVLHDGNTATSGGALYVGELVGLTFAGNVVTNITGNGFAIYYDPNLAANNYLHGLTYSLSGIGGGLLAPVPEPGTYAMLLAGIGLLGFMAWRRKEYL